MPESIIRAVTGENVNVMVFDTEMYSNTGGQASKASNIGEVCQFAAAGKEVSKKSLAEIAMSYGYVYVAQIALGANPAQAVKCLVEAEAYDGPSLIIGYAPCELHGIAKGGMNHCQDEMKKAVKAGYWNLFSFDPAKKAEGKNWNCCCEICRYYGRKKRSVFKRNKTKEEDRRKEKGSRKNQARNGQAFDGRWTDAGLD